MLTILVSVYSSQTVRRVASAVLILGLLSYIVVAAKTPPRVVQLDPITTVIEVPVEKLTTKTVTKYVRTQDRAAVEQLLADNDELKASVEQLTLSLAAAVSEGRGTATVTTPTDPADPTSPPTPVTIPLSVDFKDWRLQFHSDGTQGTYTLSQKFSIVNSMGRNDKNDPVNIVRLFEIGEHGERIPVPTTETTTISILPDQPKFYVRPSLQAGVAVLPEWSSITTGTTTGGTTTYPVSAVIAVPWWKRGTTRSVETTRYAYFTPTITFTNQQFSIGLLPVSVNIATLRYVPFTDIWAAPYLGISSQRAAKKFGLVFTTTF